MEFRDEQRRREMAASFEPLHLQPPPPHTAPISELNNPIPLSMEMVLNDLDLLTEILLRLPAKLLIRFESVCKRWLSLISSDHFCHQHTLRRPKPEPSLILETLKPPLYYFHPTLDGEMTITPYNLNVSGHRILHACNGLMLLQSKHSYYVYNPTTRRSRKILINHNDEYPHIAGINLAFDPSKSPYYRIVCIRSDEISDSDSDSDSDETYIEKHKYLIEVYESESHSWRLSLEEAMGYQRSTFHSYGVYWNNAIYWSIDEGYCYFDTVKNVIKTLPGPPNTALEFPGVRMVIPYFQESNGHLYHYVYMAGEGERESIALWELERDDDDVDDDSEWQWMLKYHHLLHPHPLSPSLDRRAYTNLLRLIDGSDGDEARSLLIRRDVKMRVYSFIDRSYKDLVDFSSEFFYYQPDQMFYLKHLPFGEVLALV